MSGPWLPAPPVTVRNSVQPLPGTKSEFASIQSDFAQDRNFYSIDFSFSVQELDIMEI